MPIDIESFERSSEEDLGGGRSQPEQVVSFLIAHSTQAFTASEVAHRIDIPQNSIGTVLKRLREKNLVRHKGDYWAITDDDQRLQGLTQYQLTAETASELHGKEDAEEWIPHIPEDEIENESDSSAEAR